MIQTNQSSIEYVSRKSRSFYWPLRLLPKDQAQAIADLYRFCRIADDWADEGESTQAREYLLSISQQLKSESPEHIEVEQALKLVSDWGVPKDALLYLIQAILDDIGPRRIENEGALIRFCYGVAGVIGLMLCPLLHVRSERAKAHAIDLGIAMQLSNISRDVLEDAERERIYIPAAWLPEVNTPQQILEANTAVATQLKTAVKGLLALADRYYQSASFGYRTIPYRSRVSIRIAGAFYREVGHCMHPQSHHQFPQPRKPRRLELVSCAMTSLLTPVSSAQIHDASLHRHLVGLPGVSITSP